MADAPQSLSKHRRYVPGYHFVTFGVLLILLFWQGYRLFRAPGFETVLGVLVAAALIGSLLYARVFALGAQDRVIRLEERLRLERLTPAGHGLEGRIDELTPRQAVGLRFASDEEVVDLALRTLDEGLGTEQIKKRIKTWRPDHFRI
ncbi:MAG: DUF6526 family protein [Acidobacteriota bacterium]